MISDADLGASAPLLRGRALRLSAHVAALGGDVWVISATRSYALQKRLWWLYVTGQRAIEAADPDRVGMVTPWGWHVHGSCHMEQPEDPDGLQSWALDLGWTGITDGLFHTMAAQHGLRRTVAGEDWHYQPFDGATLFDDQHAPTPTALAEEPIAMIHQPTPRVVAPGQTPVLDFTYLPADGQQLDGYVCRSSVAVRPNPQVGHPIDIQVFFDGAPVTVTIPDNGATVTVPVPRGGLCSVVGHGLTAEGRELWFRQ